MTNKTSTRIAQYPHLALAHEKKRELGEKTKDMVRLIVGGSDQPLTVMEIVRFFEVIDEREIHPTYVSQIANKLVDAGVFSSRIETELEHTLRGGYGNKHALLYWGQPGGVPTRTKGTVIDGVTTQNKIVKRNKKRKTKSVRASKKTSGLVATRNDETGAITAMIEALVSARTEALQNRVVELETKLAQMRNLLK